MDRTGSKLDWSRMLGFEQVVDRRSAARQAAALSAKIGNKQGVKN